MLAMGQKHNKKEKPKQLEKSSLNSTLMIRVFLSVCPSGKRFKKATYGRATGKSYSCCVRTGNVTVLLQKRGDPSDTLR